jgi:hypothetical protein
LKNNPDMHSTRLLNLFRLAKRRFTSTPEILHQAIRLSTGTELSVSFQVRVCHVRLFL